MYGIREFNGGEGVFVSAFNGKEYPYKKTPDNSDKQRARMEMEADHLVIEQNLTAKLGRAPTTREMREGRSVIEDRPLRQRIAEDATHNFQPTPTDGNPFASRLDFLLSQPRTPEVDRRIAMTTKASEAWERKQLDKQEAEAEERRISADVKDASAMVCLARCSTGWTNDEQRRAERLQTDLLRTHDVKTYRALRDALENERAERLKRDAAHVDGKAKEYATLADQVAAGVVDLHRETPAIKDDAKTE